MKRNVPSYIIDDLIRRGQLAPARRELLRLAGHRIARKERAEVALLAWRLKQPLLGARLLQPLLRSRKKWESQATPQERLAYAACLGQLGAYEEALSLLSAIDAVQLPFSLFVRATVLISHWEYGQAIAPLRAFLRSPAEPYQKMVARVNLAAALVYEKKVDKVSALLERLHADSRKAGNFRLQGSLFELMAINAWEARDLDAMAQALEWSEKIQMAQGGVDALHVQKWRAVLDLSRTGGAPSEGARLARVGQAAAASGHWELARDCAHYRAVLSRDETLFWKVYFGTPYSTFREKILREMGPGLVAPPNYLWKEGTGREKIDLRTGCRGSGEVVLDPGSNLHRLLVALSSDFFRPHRIATLHARIYQGEHFHPGSSPFRVRQAVTRLRETIAPFGGRILEADGAYRLSGEKGPSYRVYLGEQPASRSARTLAVLREAFGTRAFTSRELTTALGCHERAARRVLQSAVETGEIARQGQGPATCYRFRQ